MLLVIKVQPGTNTQFVLLDNALQGLGPLLMAPFCLYGAGGIWQRRKAASTHDTAYWATNLIAVGLVTFGIGQLVWTWYKLIYHAIPPVPYWNDLGFGMTYILLTIGIVLLPIRRSISTPRICIFLDAIMIITALMTLSWFFILGPIVLQSNDSLGVALTSAAYPLADVIMMSCLLVLSVRYASSTLRPALIVLGASLALIIMSDSLASYQMLHARYHEGTLLDIGWPLGYMLVGLAVQMMRTALVRQTEQTAPISADVITSAVEQPQTLQSSLPYILFAAVIGLIIYAESDSTNVHLLPGLFIGGTLLICLVFFRQIFAIRETMAYARATTTLNDELHETHSALTHQHLALTTANARLEQLATTDPLTQLPNHGALITTLERELERSCRHERPLSLLFFDGDRFKRINDLHGHAVGDVVLCGIAAQVNHVLRAVDTLGRYGGEEFVVILPETDGVNAAITAERIRRAVASAPMATDMVEGGLPVTISIGIATFPQDASTSNDLLIRADHAMYWAKQLGRNQVRTVADAEVACHDPRFKRLFRRDDGREAQERDNMTLAQQQQAEIFGIVYSLLTLFEVRCPAQITQAHAVSDIAASIARALALPLPDQLRVATAGLLHNIGMLGLPDSTFDAPPADNTLLRRHPDLGAQILETSNVLLPLLPAVRHHHEAWDGSGYPLGLKGDDIPLEARIVGVAEAFYTLQQSSPAHQDAATYAYDLIARAAGEQFDPLIITALSLSLTHDASEVQAA